MHPFELAGFGKAPYRCTGVSEKWFEMPGFGSKPGGTCCYCGTGILYQYHVESADGRKFHVGSDCADKIGLTDIIKAERTKLVREKRQARARMKREEREAAWKAGREAARADRSAAFKRDHAAVAAYLDAYQGDNQFLVSMQRNVAEWGGLTQGMVEAVERRMAQEAAQEALQASSKPQGYIGQRLSLQARVERIRELEPNRNVYPPQRRWLVSLMTDDGSVLVWFTTNRTLQVGDHGPVKFTVKDHSQYQGVWQTVVQRLAMKVEEEVPTV